MELTKILAALGAGAVLFAAQPVSAQQQDERDDTAAATAPADPHDIHADTRPGGGTQRHAPLHDPVIGPVPYSVAPVPDEVIAVTATDLETLARIHRDLQRIEPLPHAGDEQHDRHVAQQVEVIERHGWTRQRFNQVVEQVNRDIDLEQEFRMMVADLHDEAAGDEVAGEFDVNGDGVR